MRPVVQLAHLNEIDLVVDSIRARLAEIAEALKEPAALREARAALAEAESRLVRLQVRQSDCELRRQKAIARLAADETRLYSGKVHNPKELQDLEAELGQDRRQRDACEDELLDILIDVEAATEAQKAARTKLAQLTAAWEATQVDLRAEQARLSRRLATEAPRQAAARKTVPPELLPMYDALRARRGGRAVAELDGDVCSACKVAVSPTKISALRDGDELVYCENCGRLLFGE